MSHIYTIDELSRMAGERWAREDAEKLERVQADENKREREEPSRARPRERGAARYSTSLGGEHS